MDVLEPFDITCWRGMVYASDVAKAANALESGKILYAPQLRFELTEAERRFLFPEYLDQDSKNISWRPGSGVLDGARCSQKQERRELLVLLERYYNQASDLLKTILPGYAGSLKPGFTSFRPAEVAGRATSWQRDDTRLHVDAFPSRPMRGLQILRVFTNLNSDRPRIWRGGEMFEEVATKFMPQIRPPFPGTSLALYLLQRVKGWRTEYDHFMLRIHDRMKADQEYQSQVSQTQFAFPPDATWACFTDRVSHAAMSGQFAFEQTFYLPLGAMTYPDRTPLRILEPLVGRRLA
jgi:hypothetical protein